MRKFTALFLMLVSVTAFADGTEVAADFRQQELFVNGKRIDRPRGLSSANS